MKIRTQFIVNMVGLGIVLLLVFAAVIITNQWVEDTHQQQELATQIEREAYELGYLANDYLLYRESQQASRWESKFASFSDHLSKLQVNTPEQQVLLDNIKTNRQRLEAVFAEVRASIERASQTQEAGFDEKFMQITWGRLEVQNQGMIFNASRLQGLLNEQEHQLERLARLLSFVLIGMLGAFLLVNYGLSFRRLLQAIAKLQAGTRIIGSGDLDFAIAVQNEDEIGELSHAFNRMTEQLRTITASRADLEREIAERKQAERAQQLEHARWQGIVEGIADEVWMCDTQGKMSLLNLEAVTSMGLDIFKDKSVEEIYQEVDIFYTNGQPRPPQEAPLLHSLRGEIVRGEEIMRHRRTGVSRYRQFSSAPTRDDHGTITGAVAIVRDVTDQKIAEEGLRRFELLSANSKDIILFMRREDGSILEANAAALNAYGYSREELLALTIVDLRAPDTRSLTAGQMAQADAGGILFETVHVRKDGNTFPVEVSSQGATIGGVRTLISIIRDITERKQAEVALRESEARYRCLVESQHDLIVRVDLEGRFTFANDAYCRKFGLKREEILCKESYKPLIHPEDLPHTLEAMKALYQPPYRVLVEQRAFAVEGVRWIEWQDSAIRDETGTIVEIQAIGRDITARKQAEESLRESEQRYRGLFEMMQEGLVAAEVIIDENGNPVDYRYLDVNPATERQFGMPREHFVGHTYTEVLPEGDAEWIEIFGKVALTGEPVSLERYGRASKRWFACHLYSPRRGQVVNIVTDITERKQAEKALRESEQRLNRAQEIAHLGSWELDLVINQLTWSDEVYRIFGLQPQEFGATYEAFLEAVHPDDRAVVDAAYSRSIQAGRDSYEIEHRVVRRSNGEVHIVHEKCEHFRNEDGKIIRSIGMVHDITERKRVEQALLESEEKYRLLANHANDWIYWIQPDRRFRYVSPSCERITGFTTLEFMEKPQLIFDIIHPEDKGRVETHLGEVREGGETHNLDYRILTKTNEVRWISHSCDPVYTPDGKYMGRSGTNRDITERKQAEEALRISEERFRFALANSPIVVANLDRQLRYTWVYNPLSGFQAKDILGKQIGLGTNPETKAKIIKLLEELLDHGTSVQWETTIQTTDGEKFFTSQAEPLRNPQGEITGVALLSIDITERKRAEAEIASLAKFPTENPHPILRVQADGRLTYANAASQELLEVWGCEINSYLPQELRDFVTVAVDENLNKTVDVLCKDKVYSIMLVPIVEGGYVNIYGRDITERKRAEEALKLLAEDLRRSNAELEQFAYVASHDLQEPLRMISSYVQLLGRRYQGKLDNDADEFIHFAVDGAKRMQNLINDLLSYSRVGTRTNPLVPVSAEDILKEALANLQFLIEENGAKITHELLPAVRGDFPQLVTVFQNLIGNAIKFRGAEPPCVHIEARQAAEEWIFSVRDNGIGIDPKFAERIFVIFQRLNDRTAYPGTGIGLAICKRVIQRHGGQIWVESKPGEGATFYFTLPAKETL